MNEHKMSQTQTDKLNDKLVEFNLKGNVEGIQKHILSVSEYS